MKKKILKIIAFVSAFAVCFVICDYLGSYINIYSKFPAVSERFWILIQSIFSFLIVNCFEIFGILSDKIKEEHKSMPHVHLTKLSVTNIKRKKILGIKEIVMGEGRYFVYVKTKIENVGNGSIEECRINGQRLDIPPLDSNAEYIFYFRLCFEDEQMEINKTYSVKIDFEDPLDRKYTETLNLDLMVNVENQDGQFIVRKKQRRKYST